MKKYVNILLVALLCTGIIGGCKKDSPAKDYAASIKDKTWWGQFFYTGKPVEYYAIHFSGDSSLTWSEFSTDYPGKWVLDGNKLMISLDGAASTFKATVSDENKLADIINTQANGYNMISSEALANPANTPLDNTIWKGTAVSGSLIIALQLSFKPGLNVETKSGSNFPSTHTYIMQSGVIRVGPNLFGVMTSATEMKGSVDKPAYLWQATKQ